MAEVKKEVAQKVEGKVAEPVEPTKHELWMKEPVSQELLDKAV